MLLLLLLCILHEVASTYYKENNGLNRQFDTQTNLNQDENRYRNIMDYRDDYYERAPRRLFDWLTGLMKSNTSYKSTLRHEYEDVVKERIRFRAIEKNLTETLTQLSSVLNKILNIVKYARHDDFGDIHDHIEHALDKSKRISKRNADYDVENNRTKSDYKNATVDNKNLILNNSSGRRALIGSKVIETTDEVKNKLFNYIEEGFTEIRNNINSLKPVKNTFSKDIRYQIGYIVANIDTLDANMKNMKNSMAINKYIWSDKKILNLYDNVKMSNTAVSKLIDVLKDYLENSLNLNYYQ